MYSLTSFLSTLTIAQPDLSPFVLCPNVCHRLCLECLSDPHNVDIKAKILPEMWIHAKLG